MVRWSALSAALIALYWAVWYVITGEVPVVTTIELTKNWFITLPFAISHWYDILLGPIYTVMFFTAYKNRNAEDKKELLVQLSVGLVVGFIISSFLFSVSAHGPQMNLETGFYMFFGALSGMAFGTSLGVSLIVGLCVGHNLCNQPYSVGIESIICALFAANLVNGIKLMHQLIWRQNKSLLVNT